jgi:hypothetical protein
VFQVDVRKLKYFYMEDDGGGLLMTPAHPSVKAAVKKVSDLMQALDNDVYFQVSLAV